MKVIQRARRGGKTTELIKLAAEEWLYIVVTDHSEAFRVASEARLLGLDIPFPITWEQLLAGRFHRLGVKGFLVDNLDLMIGRVARGVPIVAVTITGDGHDL